VETVTRPLENVFARTDGTEVHALNILPRHTEPEETPNVQFVHTRKQNAVDRPEETVTNKTEPVSARTDGLVVLALPIKPLEFLDMDQNPLQPLPQEDT